MVDNLCLQLGFGWRQKGDLGYQPITLHGVILFFNLYPGLVLKVLALKAIDLLFEHFYLMLIGHKQRVDNIFISFILAEVNFL